MLVSVIIPAFNCEKSIKLTVHSIVSSGLTDYEQLFAIAFAQNIVLSNIQSKKTVVFLQRGTEE